ncbi:ComEC/Rec2 family competence protein [Clostridium rectalis]|uniref:ComEC/Rec2 family competence protein n=1 Tax=Clostridium rectalis TaxID=2040295 RepID=UPI001FAA0CF7|nr:ComEC/Rec2 family competence protein [Clostridium rectalis]
MTKILKNNNTLLKFIQCLIIVFLVLTIGGCNIEVNKDVLNNSKENVTEKGKLKVHYIDVGQGDSILLQFEDKNMLIDAGTNASAKNLIKYLNNVAVKKIDFLIATHPHEDHIGGMDDIIKNFNIGTMYMPKKTANTKTFKDVVSAMKSKNIKAKEPVAGEKFNFGDTVCEIMAPNKSKYDNINNYSIVVKVTHNNKSFLFAGDAEGVSEKEILKKGFNISADVLKLGHHGSHSSTTNEFLKRVKPKYAVVCAGRGNDYGHPHKEIVGKLRETGVKLYRTDENGTIVATSDGKNISFNCKPGSYNRGKK